MKKWKRSDIPTSMILKICSERFKLTLGTRVIHRLLDLTNAPSKVILAALERDVDAGYLEYGVSLNNPWLTEKGKDKMKTFSIRKHIKQVEKDDCVIACVAMMMNKPYEEIRQLAENFGWTPQSGGIVIHEFLNSFGYWCNWHDHLGTERPIMVSIPSLNLEDCLHLFVLDEDNNVFDPSSGKQATLEYAIENCNHSFFNIHKQEES